MKLFFDRACNLPSGFKERVAGETGHLSNGDVYKFLENAPPTLKRVYLVHVSRECNSLELLRQTFEPLAIEKGFEMHIVDPND